MAPTTPDTTQQFPPLVLPITATNTAELPPVPAGLPDFLPGVNPVYWPVNPVLPGLPTTQQISSSLPGLPETPEIPDGVNPDPVTPEPEPESEPEPDAPDAPRSGPFVMIATKVPQSLADQLDAAWRAEGFASKHAYTVWVLTNHQRLLSATAQATNLTNKLARAAVALHQMTQERDQLRKELLVASEEANTLALLNPTQTKPTLTRTHPEDELRQVRLDAARTENDRLARLHDQAVSRVGGLEQRIGEYEVMMSVLQPALDYLYGLASTASLPATPSVQPHFFRLAFEQYIQTEAEYSNQLTQQKQ